MEVARVAHARAQAAHGPHGATLARLGMLKPMPELPHGDPPLAGPDVHIKHAAIAVEDHFEVPKIGTLHKLDMGFSLSDPDLSMNPATQLRRAMHPRMRRRRFTLRLNTQRGLRRVLSGGITRQERWQLGATTKLPDSFYKLEKAGDFSELGDVIGLTRRHAPGLIKALPGLRSLRVLGQHLHDLATRPTAVGKKPSFVQIKRDLLRANMRGKERFLATDPKGLVVSRVTGGRSNVKVPDRLMHTWIGRTFHNHPGENLGIPSVSDHDVAHKLGGSRHTILAPRYRTVTHFEPESAAVRTPKTPGTLRYSNPRERVLTAGALDRFSALGKRSITEKLARLEAAAASTAHPTMAQARAGNYRMGHTSVGGLGVTIETPKGRHRRGIGVSGKFWSVKMPAHYGYIKRTEGADGDHVDVYLGPHAHRAEHHPVYIVDQQHAETKRFDEHKAMLGFRDREHATGTYDAGFSDGRGPDRRRAVHEVTFADFKHWVGNGDTTKPYKAALKKGVIADAMQFGAAYLPKLGRAATQMTGTSGRAAGMLGRSRAGQLGAKVGRRVAANPGVQRVAAHPRVAPALSEARGLGPKGFIAPLHAAGRIAGAAAAGERGAKIGGNVGLAADYAPVAYTAASAGQALMAGHRQKNDLPPARTLTQQLEDKALGKGMVTGLLNATARGVARHTFAGARGAARHIAGLSRRQKFMYGAAGGAAAAQASGATDNHPGRGAAAGAALGGVGAAILSRGRAVGGVTRSARAIYTTGMKDAVREHLRVLAGANGSPHHIAQAASVFRANQAHLIRQSRAKYAAGMAGARAKKGTIAAGALGGAAIGASTVGRSRWKDQPLAGE